MDLSLIFTGTAPLPLFERCKINLLNVEINEIIINFKLKPKKCGKKRSKKYHVQHEKTTEFMEDINETVPITHFNVCSTNTTI